MNLTLELRSKIGKVDLSFKGEGGNLDVILAEALKNEKENLKEVLQYATAVGNIEVVKSLIESMPNVAERKKIIFADDCQAIRNAAEKGDVRIIGLLLRASVQSEQEFHNIVRSGDSQVLNPISGASVVPVFFAVMLGEMKVPKELKETFEKYPKEIKEFKGIRKFLTEKFSENKSTDATVSGNTNAPNENLKLAKREANDAMAVLLTFKFDEALGSLSKGQKKIVSDENARISDILDKRLIVPEEEMIIAPKKTLMPSEFMTDIVRKANTGKNVSFAKEVQSYEAPKWSEDELEGDEQQVVDVSEEEGHNEQPKSSVFARIAEEVLKNTISNTKVPSK